MRTLFDLEILMNTANQESNLTMKMKRCWESIESKTNRIDLMLVMDSLSIMCILY